VRFSDGVWAGIELTQEIIGSFGNDGRVDGVR
jgi:dynactin complex subunit